MQEVLTKKVVKKVHLISLGCARNRVDSEVMLGGLLGEGWRFEPAIENCDVVIVNTCGFIEAAKEESINTILDCAAYKKDNPDLKVIVAGCLTQRYKSQLAKGLPEVDLFVGTDEFVKLPQLLADAENSSETNKKVHAKRTHYIYDEHYPRINTLSTHSAYVKVAEGCQHNCAFCIIPAIRGKLRSRSIASVVAEVKTLTKNGVKEINLIAQDLAAYGRDREDKADLLALLKELVKIEDLKWIRLLYMYPENITDDFLEFFAQEEKLVKYLDIPVQHASNRLLKTMNRGVTREMIEDTLNKLRTKIPEIAIRTSVMVGFPGETEEDFAELLNFVQKMKINHLGCFTYSKEEGTVAARMPDQIEEATKKARQELIMAHQQQISHDNLMGHIGQSFEVIIEKLEDQEENLWQARLSTQAPEVDGLVYVEAASQDLQAGDFCQVKITDADDYDLRAQLK